MISIHGQSSGKEATALKNLDRDLMQIEILLKELDVQLSKDIAYGWREDVTTRLEEWRDSVRSAFSRLRSSVRKFWTSLTTREGERLPAWIYSSFGGALDDVMKMLEARLQVEDDGVRTAILEVVKNAVKIYRNRIKEASEKKPTETSETSPTASSGTTSPTTEATTSSYEEKHEESHEHNLW